jgi:transposase-like protein
VVKYCSPGEGAFRCRERPVQVGWRLVETDITINGSWSDLERAMDRLAQGVDSLPTPNCAEQVATTSSPRPTAINRRRKWRLMGV